MPPVDLSRDRIALSGKFPENDLRAGPELELRNMLNFDAFQLVDELPPGKWAYDMVWVDEWRGDRVRSRLCVRQFKAEGLRKDLFAVVRGNTDTTRICWQTCEFSHQVDISVAFMHARTDEEIYVKVPSDIKAALNGIRKASKHWQEYSSDKLVTTMLFQRMTWIRVLISDFMTSWIWSSTAMISWWLDQCQSWNVWLKSSRVIFSRKRRKLWVWDLNTWVKLISSNVVSVWTGLGGKLSWIKGMCEVCWMQWPWVIANRWQLLDRRDRRIMVWLRSCWTTRNTLSSDPVLEYSVADKVEADRALLQRTPAMCLELPLGCQVGGRHPCDSGCRLGWRSKDTVLNVWTSIGNQPGLHFTWLVGGTSNSVTIIGWVRGQGDHEGLYWSLVRETSAGASDCKTIQNQSLDRQQQSKPLWKDLGQGAEQNTWKCKRYRFNSWTRSVSFRWTSWIRWKMLQMYWRNTFRKQYLTSWLDDELHVSWWRDSKVSSVREHQSELLESEDCSRWENAGIRR